MPSLMFQICTDADHVNGKGILKRGRGSTGKKHEERESEKRKQNRQLEMRLPIGLGFMLGFVPFFQKKVMIIPSIPWLA